MNAVLLNETKDFIVVIHDWRTPPEIIIQMMSMAMPAR